MGRKVPRNIYCDGEPVAMVAGPKDEAEILAAFIVAACNEKDEREADL